MRRTLRSQTFDQPSYQHVDYVAPVDRVFWWRGWNLLCTNNFHLNLCKSSRPTKVLRRWRNGDGNKGRMQLVVHTSGQTTETPLDSGAKLSGAAACCRFAVGMLALVHKVWNGREGGWTTRGQRLSRRNQQHHPWQQLHTGRRSSQLYSDLFMRRTLRSQTYDQPSYQHVDYVAPVDRVFW